MNILFIARDRRSNAVSLTHQLERAIEDAGHEVIEMNPWQLVAPHQREVYMNNKKPYPLETIAGINDFDVLFMNNFPLVPDFSNLKVPSVFLYDEPYKSCQFVNADYVMTLPNSVKDLMTFNPYELSKVRAVNLDTLKGCVDPDAWPETAVEKTIPFAYMGSTHISDHCSDLIASDFSARRDIGLWARDNLECQIPFEARLEEGDEDDGINRFYATFPRVDVCLHFSTPSGVGQGAFEAGICGCKLLEFCPPETAAKAGLIDGKNCLLFQDRDELSEQYAWMLLHPFESRKLARNLTELVKETRTYKVMTEPADRFINKIMEKENETSTIIRQRDAAKVA